MKDLIISQDGIRYVFGGDGFLAHIQLTAFGGEPVSVFSSDFGRIHIQLSDGRTLSPYLRDDAEPLRGKFRDAELVEFPEILWRDETGAPQSEFRLALRYELWPGGRGFVSAFFCANTMHTPALDEFSVKFNLELEQYQTVKWAVIPRPQKIDGALIQAMGNGRFIDRGVKRHIDGCILPSVSVNTWRADGQSGYLEFFMEGQNSIRETADDNYTDIAWTNRGDMNTTFSFVKETPCESDPMRLWQWRNRWGWVLKFADHVRQKPPFHMYHYLDNYHRYPGDEAIANIAASGADILILHENWRLDIQDDGFPFDPAELDRTVASAHAHGLRIMLYIRGNERSAVESACEWFDRHLKKDFDGLYMDYGGPIHSCEVTESYPGGRIGFREYFLRMLSLRERIGQEGLFFAHIGPSFSGVAFPGNVIDGYVSGEGEAGVMVNSRLEHAYYSMAAVSPGTMWTGAFPAYSTARMRPFLAATGQYPHSPLGVQFQTSSLAHPSEPGLNDTAFKPLWKLWRFFRNERNIRIFNDYNTAGVFFADPEVGHSLFVSADSARALLILSNFTDGIKRVSTATGFSRCGFSPAGMSAWQMTPSERTPGRAVPVDPAALPASIELGPYDVAALYFDRDAALTGAAVRDFEGDYPALTASNHQHLELLAEQTFLRKTAAPMTECYCRVSVPSTDLPYEYSLIYDLYYNAMELVEFLPDGGERPVGWITRTGFSEVEPKPEDYVWPDTHTPWIPLHKIFPRGDHFIGIRSLHYEKPFYNFLSLELAASSDGRDAKTLVFMNELEPRREYLRWRIAIR